MKHFFTLLGDLLFHAFSSRIERELAGRPELDNQAFYEACYGGSGVRHLARVHRDGVKRKFHFRAESWNLFDGSMRCR
jgi:hypothetical protein